MSDSRGQKDPPLPPEPGGRPHHPLPSSEEARHEEVPEEIEAEKGRGDDGAERVSPPPQGFPLGERRQGGG